MGRPNSLAADLLPENGLLHQVKEGSKGDVIAEFAALRYAAYLSHRKKRLRRLDPNLSL